MPATHGRAQPPRWRLEHEEGESMTTLTPAVRLASIALALTLGASPAHAKPPEKQSQQTKKITHADRQAAAARAKAKGFKPIQKEAQKGKERTGPPGEPRGGKGASPIGNAAALLMELVTAQTPRPAPHYFSHPNYANSPLPTV